ncbi:helix-turn-helix domain-containing protein [Streptomyces sp. NPDC001941]|uniref:TetR/AcrR family transcriptional regulator n=1 Tax=Streptomyces sp. NPDC001941 TaxID=3154659 RepID=UPI00331A3727
MTDTAASKRRAAPMAPDQRRAMIVAAALPLVVEFGAGVSTAKIARAAGIGEGTLFRAFEDKDSLLAACMAEAVRPDVAVAHLQAVPLDQPLADRLAEAVDVLRGFMARLGAVAGALATAGGARTPPPGAREPGRAPDREAALAAPRAALARLFEPERERLRLSPERLADAFQFMLMGAGRSGAPEPLSTEEIVELFLHGALAGGGEGAGAGGVA